MDQLFFILSAYFTLRIFRSLFWTTSCDASILSISWKLLILSSSSNSRVLHLQLQSPGFNSQAT